MGGGMWMDPRGHLLIGTGDKLSAHSGTSCRPSSRPIRV